MSAKTSRLTRHADLIAVLAALTFLAALAGREPLAGTALEMQPGLTTGCGPAVCAGAPDQA